MTTFCQKNYTIPDPIFPFSVRELLSARKEYRNFTRREAEIYLDIHRNYQSPHYLPYLIYPSHLGEPYHFIAMNSPRHGIRHFLVSQKSNGDYVLYKPDLSVYRVYKNETAFIFDLCR